MMRKLILTVLGLATFSVMAQVTGIHVEEIDNQGKVPGSTYRIYVQCKSRLDRVTAVFAFDGHDMYLRSTKPFFQSAYGGALASNVIRATVLEKSELRYDSWLTIGNEDNYSNFVAPFNLDLEEFENGGNIETDDGAWYVTPDKTQTKPDENQRVLVAQLTSEGIISGQFSVTGRTITGHDETGLPNEWETWEIHELSFTAGEK